MLGTTSRKRSVALPLFVVLAAVVAAFVVLPSTASAFNIANFNYTNSSTQAAGHPDVTISFNRQGSESEDLKDVQLDLPTGVFANPEANNPKCTTAQFNSDACPGNSQIGAVDTTVKALGLLDLDIHGSIDLITPEANQVATLGLTLRPERICILFVFCAQPNKIFMKTGITVRSYEDSGLRTYTPGTPRTAVIGIPLLFVTPTINGDITINKLSLSFQSRAGSPTTSQVCTGWGWFKSCKNVTNPPSGGYFWTQTGSCLPATSNVTIVSYQGASSSASKTFTPTGCNNVPFNPSLSFSPEINDGGEPSAVNFSLAIPEADAPIQNSLPKIVDADFPNGSGLNLDGLSGVTGCTEAQLQVRACPASSIIGTANAFSKYLPGPNSSTAGLIGNVYAMGVGTQVPIGVELVGPRNTIVIFRGTLGTRGDANAGTGRVYATFDRIPQLPFSSFSLRLAKPIYKNPDVCGTATTNAQITGFNGTTATGGNGTVVSRSSSYEVVNCDLAPDTSITAGPPSTTPVNTPTFEFTSTISGSAFQCRVDSEPFAPCTSPFTTQPLSDGPHTFEVKAINGPTEDATPASDSFTVDTTGIDIVPSINVSTTQAVAHPDVDAGFAISGGQPKTIALKMPNGFSASLSAVPSCSNADALAGTCPAASKVGTASLTADTFSGPETGTGDIFLTEGPTGNDAGGIAAKITFSFGEFIAQGGAYLVDNGKNQYLDLRNIPVTVGSTAINITNLDVSLSGANSFLTNPSNCSTASAWISTGEDYSGNTASVFSVPFQATGCSTVPFNPQITQTLSSPVAGTETGVEANITLDPDNSAIKTLRVSEPPSLSPNFPAFGQSEDQCPASAAPTASSVFDPTVCPPQAVVGSMVIDTPLLPFDLTGTVYLIEKSPIPWLGVAFDNPGISVRLTGVTATPQVDPSCNPLFEDSGFCQTQISVIFNNVPDVPISGIDFTLDGPTRAGVLGPLSGKILSVATPSDPTCVASTPSIATFIPFTGTPNVVRSQNIPISGCA